MMKRIFAAGILMVMLLLSSCNSYSAIGLVRSSIGGEASMKFVSFKGHQSFTLFADSDDTAIEYEATLDEGEMTVYYYDGDIEKLLFTIRGGDRVDSELYYGGGNLRIKLVADEKCRGGSFEFELD